MEDCILLEMGRAGIWYTENISMKNCTIEAPKTFRRASGFELIGNYSFDGGKNAAISSAVCKLTTVGENVLIQTLAYNIFFWLTQLEVIP